MADLQVKFTHSNTVRDKKPYTIYEIEVRSSSTITWVIYKRYSDFHTLHGELMKNQTVLASSFTGKQSAKGLPHLPPKRLTRSLAAEFVEKRKQELQEYLRELLANPAHFTSSNVLIQFLEVPDSVRPMIAGAARGGNAHHAGGGFQEPADAKESLLNAKNNFQHNTAEERRVLELNNLLRYHPNKVAAIKSFEEYFFDQRPRLSAEYIRLLFQGKSGADGEGGLIQTCGDFGYSHVASRAALYLLCRLLDVEKNKDAQLFVDQFVSLEVNVLRKMQLHLHILSERGNRLGAFRIVSIIRNNANPSGGNGKAPDTSIEQIVSDQWARQEYLKWAERKTDQVAPYSHETQDKTLKSLSLNEIGYKAIAAQAFADLLKCNADNDGWRLVTDPLQQQQQQAVAAASGGGGSSAQAAAAAAAADDIRITYKTDTAKDLVTVKVSCVVPYALDQVTALLLDLRKRKLWDLKFHRGKRIAKLDAASDVAHMIFRSFSSPYKYRDFCVLRSWAKTERGQHILAARSILHPNAPEYKDNVRAVLFPSGYILTPVALDAKGAEAKAAPVGAGAAAGAGAGAGTRPGTHVVFIGQMDRESVLIVSPDLLGETSELRQSFQLIRSALQNPAATATASATVAAQSQPSAQHAAAAAGLKGAAAAGAGGAGGSASILSALSGSAADQKVPPPPPALAATPQVFVPPPPQQQPTTPLNKTVAGAKKLAPISEK